MSWEQRRRHRPVRRFLKFTRQEIMVVWTSALVQEGQRGAQDIKAFGLSSWGGPCT